MNRSFHPLLRAPLRAVVASSLMATAGILAAQPGLGGRCVPAPPEGCVCLVAGTEHDVVFTRMGTVVHELKKGAWDSSAPCNCAYIPCGLRQRCEPAQRMHSEQAEVCWEVGAGAEAELGTGLIEELLVELGVSVAVDGRFRHCHRWTDEFRYFVPVSDCFTSYIRPIWTESKVTATKHRVKARTHWVEHVTDPDGSVTSVSRGYTTCGETAKVSGSAKLKGGRGTHIAPFPERCGGAVWDPDPNEGKRMEPCCSPLPPCDELGPGDVPCCGCWGIWR